MVLIVQLYMLQVHTRACDVVDLLPQCVVVSRTSHIALAIWGKICPAPQLEHAAVLNGFREVSNILSILQFFQAYFARPFALL